MNRCWHIMALICVCSSLAHADDAGPSFSALSPDRQQQIRKMAEPPPLAQRHGPYSTPMYYLMAKGYTYEGSEDKGPDERCYIKNAPGPDFGTWKLDRNRPDWQEAMIRDWAEMGMNNTHLNIFPQNNSLDISPDYLQAITDFARLSAKHGMQVGVRLDALGGTVAWEMNPANPQNQIEPYLTWVKTIARALSGKTAYYVLGDEITLHEQATKPKDWTAANYLAYFRKVSAAIKEVDPTAKVSMFGASSGEWFNVLYLLKLGYADFGDAVAINFPDYSHVAPFFEDAKRLAPKLLFLSNGVGYCSTATATPRYPEGDPYGRLPSEADHASAVAKSMFAWWDLGAATAPYYISLRNWVVEGKTYPRWFGFFGFEDFVVQNDVLTVKHYPAWYAYQTVASTFYDRSKFRSPSFEAKVPSEISMFRAYEHATPGGKTADGKTPAGNELLLMMWNDGDAKEVSVDLGTVAYRYPVRVSLTDHAKWTDVPYQVRNGRTIIPMKVGPEPIIIRMVRED